MDNLKELVEEYTRAMSQQEKLVMEIAKDHLGSSFDIERSVGFIKWLAKRETTTDNKKQ